MGHMERQRLHVVAYPGERVHPGKLGEGRWLESNSEIFEEVWRSASGEVMAHKTEVGQVFLVDM
jgi:hypothetical protein